MLTRKLCLLSGVEYFRLVLEWTITYHLKNRIELFIVKCLNKEVEDPRGVQKKRSFEKEFANFCVDVTASK